MVMVLAPAKPKTQQNLPAVAAHEASVHITSSGFQPGSLAVKANTEVTWINDDTSKIHIIAANPYPQDNSLPGLKSPQLGQGTRYSYTFRHAGTYQYHDDLNPSLNGTVLVR